MITVNNVVKHMDENASVEAFFDVKKMLKDENYTGAKLYADEVKPNNTRVSFEIDYDKIISDLKPYIRRSESNGDDKAVNKQKNQTASGRYQFVRNTFRGLNKKYNLGYDWQKDKFNPEAQEKMLKLYTKEHVDSFNKNFGRVPNRAELYGHHFLGTHGYKKFHQMLQKNPRLKTTDFFSKKVLRVNSQLFDKKTKKPKKLYEVYNWLAEKTNSEQYGMEKQDLSSLRSSMIEGPNEGKVVDGYGMVVPEEVLNNEREAKAKLVAQQFNEEEVKEKTPKKVTIDYNSIEVMSPIMTTSNPVSPMDFYRRYVKETNDILNFK